MTTPPPGPPQQPGWPPSAEQPCQQQPLPPGYGYPAYGPGYPQHRPTSGRATAVMVLGIVGLATFFTFCGIGVFAAIAALVLAPGANREIAASGGQLEGEGKIRVGVILSWVTVGLTVLAIVVVAGVFAIGASTTSDTSGVRHANAVTVTLVTSG